MSTSTSSSSLHISIENFGVKANYSPRTSTPKRPKSHHSSLTVRSHHQTKSTITTLTMIKTTTMMGRMGMTSRHLGRKGHRSESHVSIVRKLVRNVVIPGTSFHLLIPSPLSSLSFLPHSTTLQPPCISSFTTTYSLTLFQSSSSSLAEALCRRSNTDI
jgi:hypothetical protein